MFELKNKIALITGGASGIGLAYAKELLRRKLRGVSLVDINEENGIKAVKEIITEFKRDDCVIFVKADVTNSKQLEDAFETTVKKYNQLDILFNNAGVVHEIQWQKCVDINLSAVINGSMLAIEKYFPKYRNQSESLIINTASIVGLTPTETVPVYVATKSAVIAFTRSMGGDTRYEASKTRVIAICPGKVYTPILHATADQLKEPFLSDLQYIAVHYPGQKPEEFAIKVIDIIADAPTGSVWLAIPESCTMVEFPVYGLPVDQQ